MEIKIIKNIFSRVLRRFSIGRILTREHEDRKPGQDDQIEQVEQPEHIKQIEHTEQIAQIKPDHLKTLLLLKEQGDWFTLLEKGRELLLQNPPQYDAIEFVAYNLQQSGQLEAAAEIAGRATELSPDFWMFHFLAGVALKGTGRKKEACKFLLRAVAIRPNDEQTMREWIEAIATSEGIELASAEYASHCRQMGSETNIVVAPISAVRDWAKKVGLSLLEAGEVEEIPFKAPHIWGSPLASDTVFALSNKPYVAEIKDARIFSNSSIIFTPDGTALNDNAGHSRFGRCVSFAYEAVVLAQESDKLLLNFTKYATREIEAGIFLAGLASNAFGHWLPEFLPKLQFFQQHPDFDALPIIVDKDMPQSHFDHLRRLVNNPLILLEANESLLCQRLLVAPSFAFFPVETFPNDIPVQEFPGLSPRALRFLRADVAVEIKKPQHRRLFLARKNMKWRRLLNEDEIAADLSQLGFETIFIEEMAVSEQIDLFQQAEFIVAPNGSSLLNLIFADTSTKLLVLIQPNVFNWGTFQGPMDALGYQSLCVCGDYALSKDQKHSDYHIPVARIREALCHIGMNDDILVGNFNEKTHYFCYQAHLASFRRV